MSQAKGFAAFSPYTKSNPLKAFEFQRREPGADDVQIDIHYCGVCHSDLHTVNGDWGPQTFPLVPGHEIVGKVEKVGNNVTKYKVGDLVGVGCFVDSCRECVSCKEGLENYCERGATMTYGAQDKKSGGITQGGYSTKVVVDQNYVVRVPDSIPLDQAAPLLCAGITTYSPLRHWKVKKGQKVGVAGLGGLGHMAVKLAASMGAEVTVLSTSENKREDAMKLGAHKFAVTKNEKHLAEIANSFDLILDTISASHDYNQYANFLKRDGTLVLLGLPSAQPLEAFALVPRRRAIAGSMIGGIAETQEMLDYCATHKLAADVEVIPMEKISEAYERMLKGDVHYRFVIDMKSIKG